MNLAMDCEVDFELAFRNQPKSRYLHKSSKVSAITKNLVRLEKYLLG